MENSTILNKVNSILMSNEAIEPNFISLHNYIEYIKYIKNDIALLYKETIKKINNSFKNNFNFFDYCVTSLEVKNKIFLKLECNVFREVVEIDKENYKILSKIKNKESLENLIHDNIKDLMQKVNAIFESNKVTLKDKFGEININIENENVEIFAYKSPNWITMGKAFSLKFDGLEGKYLYELDHIKLENSIKNQEDLLFSKITFKFEKLPQEVQRNYLKMQEESRQKKMKKKNIFKVFMSKIKKMMKKQ